MLRLEIGDNKCFKYEAGILSLPRSTILNLWNVSIAGIYISEISYATYEIEFTKTTTGTLVYKILDAAVSKDELKEFMFQVLVAFRKEQQTNKALT